MPTTTEETGTEEANDAWSCPICLSWFDMPVAPPCQHSFCSACLKSTVRAAAHRQHRNGTQAGPARPACPLCRETFSPETVAPNNRVFEEMLKATVSCRNGDCTAQFCPLRWKHHQEECSAATVQCTHQVVGCAWKGVRKVLSTHVECCPYEKIKGLIPRVSTSLKQIHSKVHRLEARVMAQNAAVASSRAIAMSMHQRERRGAVFPAAYALLWRPPDWRRFSCPNQAAVLSNATLISLAPIGFLALWGAGMFNGGSDLSLEQRAVCLAGVATLGFLAFLEYDNSTPWHELQKPRLLKGVRIGPTLLENTARFVVYCAVMGLPQWKRLPALLLLLAPLTYPTVVQGLHRFQVKMNAHNQAQLPQGYTLLPSIAPTRPSPIKVHGRAVNGAIRAVASCIFGIKIVFASQFLAKTSVCLVSAVFGAEKINETQSRVWAAMSAGLSQEERHHLQELRERSFGAIKAPFPNITSRGARACFAGACMCVFGAIVMAFRDSLDMIGLCILFLLSMDSTHLRWEVYVGRWVMASLEQTSTRLNNDRGPASNSALGLLRSRVLLLWVVLGSLFFCLFFFTS